MDSVLILGLAALMLLQLVFFGVLFLRRRDPAANARAEAMETSISTLTGKIEQITGAIGQISQDQSSRHAALSAQLNERLDAVSQRVGQSLTEQGTKTAESLGQLQQRLTTIDEAQKNIMELSGQVVSLQDILANKQARGAFGQIQMEDIVRKALPPSAYDFQFKLSNDRRPDCVIHLPHPPGSIAIDAKFPLEPFHALRNAENEAALKDATRLFRTALQKHIDDIAGKYIIPGETAESALMFLPSEAVYAELYANFPEVVEKSHAARVYIVSPTTLMATLNTVRAVLKDARMREQAHVIQREVGKMTEDVGRLAKRVDNLRTHFSQAERDIKEIETSANKIVRTAERIEEVQLEGAETGDVIEPAAEPRIRAVNDQS